jgi:hypothetical protein
VVSEYLAALPDNFDSKEALRRQEDAVDAAWEHTRVDVQRTLPEILSPVQMRLLPQLIDYLMKAKGKVEIRMFSSD